MEVYYLEETKIMAHSVLLDKKYLTYDDIHNLPAGNYEIIDGERTNMSPTGFEHGQIELALGTLLKNLLNEKKFRYCIKEL